MFQTEIIIFLQSFASDFLTAFLKNLFALPRPANVDSNVLLPGKDYPNPTTLKSMGAKSFFGQLPREAVDHLRIHRIDSCRVFEKGDCGRLAAGSFSTLLSGPK